MTVSYYKKQQNCCISLRYTSSHFMCQIHFESHSFPNTILVFENDLNAYKNIFRLLGVGFIVETILEQLLKLCLDKFLKFLGIM